MKCPGKIAIIVLVTLAGYFPVPAGDLPSLKRPPVPAEPGPKSKLPEIVPNGVMTLFGKKQVLFRVTGAVQSDGSAGESSCVLEVGESQNGIKVVSVDDDSKTVTFDNHGTVQIIALQTATLVSAPAPVPSPIMTLQSAPLQPPPPPAALPALPVEQTQSDDGATMVTIGSRPAAAPRFKHQLGLSAPVNPSQAGDAVFAPPPLPAGTGAAASVPAPTEALPPVFSQQPPRAYPSQGSGGATMVAPSPPPKFLPP